MLPVPDNARWFTLPAPGLEIAHVGVLSLPDGRWLETRRAATAGEALSELARALAGRAPWRTHLDEVAAILNAFRLNSPTPSLRAAEWKRLWQMMHDPSVCEAEVQSTVQGLLTDFCDDAVERRGYLERAVNLMVDPLAAALFERGPGGETLEPIGNMLMCGVRAAMCAFLIQALALGVIRVTAWDCVSPIPLAIDAPPAGSAGGEWAATLAAAWVDDAERWEVYRWIFSECGGPPKLTVTNDGRWIGYMLLRDYFSLVTRDHSTTQVHRKFAAHAEITRAILHAV